MLAYIGIIVSRTNTKHKSSEETSTLPLACMHRCIFRRRFKYFWHWFFGYRYLMALYYYHDFRFLIDQKCRFQWPHVLANAAMWKNQFCYIGNTDSTQRRLIVRPDALTHAKFVIYSVTFYRETVFKLIYTNDELFENCPILGPGCKPVSLISFVFTISAIIARLSE